MNNTVEEVVEVTYKELYLKALDKIDELEKALDKACALLEYKNTYFANNEVYYSLKTKEEWKEWLFEE